MLKSIAPGVIAAQRRRRIGPGRGHTPGARWLDAPIACQAL